jgi:hypothetical protein
MALATLATSALVLVACGSSRPTSTSVVSTTTPQGSPITTSDPVHGPVAGPHGWQPGDFDRARLWVPPAWEIDTADSSDCGEGHGLLVLGTVLPSQTGCGPQVPSGPVVTLRTIHSVPSNPRVSHVNGYRILSPRSAPASTRILDVPALGVTITTTGAVPAGVLASLGPSPEGVVTGPGRAAPVPLGWHRVTYNGISADVPAAWPTVDAAHAGVCGHPFTHPTVFVGAYTGPVPSCPAELGEAPPADGICIQPGTPTAATTTAQPVPSGPVVRLEADNTVGPMITFWSHGNWVQLGVGTNPFVERAVFDSIRFHAGTPDTPVLGVCPTAVEKIMPAPQRLTSRLLLEQGDFTLDPPNPGDTPTMTAARAWNEVGPKIPGETYRLILSRLSARFPANVVKGKDIPVYQHLLTWTVYSVPALTSEGPCSNYTLTSFDARTGKEILGAGYGKGP